MNSDDMTEIQSVCCLFVCPHLRVYGRDNVKLQFEHSTMVVNPLQIRQLYLLIETQFCE